MQKSKLFLMTSILFLIVIVILLAKLYQFSEIADRPSNAVLENIFARKSVRAYTEQAVNREQLDTLARTAMAAPTGMGKEPWLIVLIDERAILDSLSAALPNASMLANAGAALVVCGDTLKAPMDVHPYYWVQDCSAASENVLLAAESMGLGAVWTGVWPRPARLETVIRILDLPAHIIPLNIIAIGYPLGEETAKDKYKPENIRWNKFQKQ